ncbi:LacI family DNA-binding transcriptional regulator [Clostridium sp.]|uniref:LacI family DNA-binding transcriptional regulator n=1 Tax=Clostridium sp. TaxID=1506 RepID=UPI003F3A9899
MSLNIIDIAKLSGVSKSTVSRYLNNGYVSKESSDKIKAVIEETGFLPQRQAQSMRTKKTNLIGVIVPKISSETASRVIEGMTEIFSPNGYDVLIANTNLSIEKELEYLKIFKNNGVDGVIFMATKVTETHLKAMAEVRVPIVVVAQEIKEYPSVYNDDYNAAKDSTIELIKNSHKDIGFIGIYEEDISVGLHRKQGYLDALLENKIEINRENIKIGDFSQESGYALAKELLNKKEIPTAILAVTDTLAIGAMEYILEKGYKIPEDIAIIGMGDSKISRVVTPKLTTIHYHYKTSGRESAKIMMEMINDGIISSKNKGRNVKLSYGLIKRDSI